MPTYIVVNYDLVDEDLYQEYVGVVGPVLKVGEVTTPLAVDPESEGLEGTPGRTTVILRYETEEAARSVWESGEYRAIVGKRLDSTTNHFAVMVKGLE